MEDNSNKINPYRILGKFHNEGMDYVIERILNKDIRGISIEEIVELVSEYLSNIYKENSKIDLAINYEIISKVLNKYKQLTLEEILKLSDITLSEKAISYLKQLDDLDLENPDAASQKMKEIEQDILNSDLSVNEQQYPLVFIAVAEASIEYMNKEKEKENNSLWSKFTYQLKIFPWKSDGIGAVGGLVNKSIFGSIGFLLGGPIVSVISVGVGAVGSGIVASVKDIIFPPKEIKKDLKAKEKIRDNRLKKLKALAPKSPFKSKSKPKSE